MPYLENCIGECFPVVQYIVKVTEMHGPFFITVLQIHVARPCSSVFMDSQVGEIENLHTGGSANVLPNISQSTGLLLNTKQ